jgi:hypothetical protein
MMADCSVGTSKSLSGVFALTMLHSAAGVKVG